MWKHFFAVTLHMKFRIIFTFISLDAFERETGQATNIVTLPCPTRLCATWHPGNTPWFYKLLGQEASVLHHMLPRLTICEASSRNSLQLFF